MTLVVILTVRSEAIEQFHAFERKAAEIMARYGGAIERTVIVSPENASDRFREIHIVTFPDAEAFAAYRADSELRSMGYLREESVIATEILVGEDGPDYHALVR